MKTDSMGMEWQQRGARHPHPGPHGEGSTQPGGCEVRQVPAAQVPSPAVATQHLMNQVCSQTNLEHACQRVRANGGAPGIDGMSVDALPAWLAANQGPLIERLQQGTYQPTPVRGVLIPKPSGGSRQLGIPTVSSQKLGVTRTGSAQAGRVRVNRVPCPGVLSTATVPPWASAISFTMASPSPVPPDSLARAGSAR